MREDALALVRTAIRNVWNMGGLVGIAQLDSASQERLAEVAEVNAMREIERALDVDLGTTKGPD